MAAAATVVLVGDDPDVVLLCRASLESEGFVVLEARVATAAFDLVRDAVPDVVLVHAAHGGSGGADLLARLAADSRTREVPVVLLTGEVEDGDLGWAWRSGATEVVIGTPGPTELARVMADVVATTPQEAAQRRRRAGRGRSAAVGTDHDV